MNLELTGRVVVVTGAGRGIGAATAAMLAREGATIAILDQDEEPAGEVADQINTAGGKAIGLACDIIHADAVEAAFAQVVQVLGSADILVNNAGIVRDRSLLKMQETDWDAVINVTLKGSFLCAKAVIPNMREKKWGRIVNISSRSIFGNPGQTNYAAAKAGIIGFTRSLSLEQAPHGITVNAIAPGFIATEGMRSIPNYPELHDRSVARTPVGFLGEPEDIASTVAFIASPRARYITGTTIFVTGGRFSS